MFEKRGWRLGKGAIKTKTDDVDKNRKWHPDRAVLAQYRADQLTPRIRRVVQGHLSTCTGCRTAFLRMCRT